MSTAPITIFSTKILPQPQVERAWKQHIYIDAANFIDIQTIRKTEVIEQIKSYITQPITALFTSANAVAAVGEHLSQRPAWRIFCLSGKTKTALLEYFNEDYITAAAPNAVELIPEIMAAKPVGDCVFFCGNKHLNTLPEAFLVNGMNLNEVVVYETILSPKKISNTYDGILFFSPSAVESFFSVNKTNAKTVYFSVGKTTEEAIKKCTDNPIITAGFPSVENMIQKIQSYFKTT